MFDDHLTGEARELHGHKLVKSPNGGDSLNMYWDSPLLSVCDMTSNGAFLNSFKLLVLVCFSVESRVIPKYIGCIKDVQDGLLIGFIQNYPALTVEACRTKCFLKGYSYAGLQTETCKCGDLESSQWTSEKVDNSECNITCLGNKNQKCGGSQRISLHFTGLKDISTDEKEIGCMSDEGLSRLIPEHKIDLSNNSPKRCVSICNSLAFKYAGLRNSYECYCGTVKEFRPLESGCDLPCPTDTNVKCGGKWKMMVYKTGILDGIPTAKIFYLGCFENRPNGLLKHFKQEMSDLSPFKCISKCFSLSFQLAALHDGTECQCGLTVLPIPEVVPDSMCTTPCPGDPNKICGSDTHVSSYNIGIIGDSIMGRSIGCFQDEQKTLLTGATLNLGRGITPHYCIYRCMELGFIYAGLRNSFECICGSYVPNRITSKELPDSSCQSDCPLNKFHYCGGLDSTFIYRTGLELITGSGCINSISEVDGKSTCSSDILFEESFDSLTPSIWQKQIKISGEDYEFVTYNSDAKNSYIQSGKLIIKPSILQDNFVLNGSLQLRGCTGQLHTEECTLQAKSFQILPPVQSAQLCTKNSFNFKYGVITVRAKLPEGDWLLPQIYLRPVREVYGPRYMSGKIILGMARGNEKLVTPEGKDIGANFLENGIYLSDRQGTHVKSKTAVLSSTFPWSNAFHNYSLIWTPDIIAFYVDGKISEAVTAYESKEGIISSVLGLSGDPWKTGTFTAPFDEKFCLCLGVSAGGNRHFPDDSVSGKNNKPWTNWQIKGKLNFWLARRDWLETWSEKSILEVDHITVTAL